MKGHYIKSGIKKPGIASEMSKASKKKLAAKKDISPSSKKKLKSSKNQAGIAKGRLKKGKDQSPSASITEKEFNEIVQRIRKKPKMKKKPLKSKKTRTQKVLERIRKGRKDLERMNNQKAKENAGY